MGNRYDWKTCCTNTGECMRKGCPNKAALDSFWCKPECNPFFVKHDPPKIKAAIQDKEFFS